MLLEKDDSIKGLILRAGGDILSAQHSQPTTFNRPVMKMKPPLKAALFALAGLVGISTASAQTTNLIFGTDFDGNGNLSYAYGYAYAGGNLGAAASAFAGGITAGVGVTNSAAFDSMPDFTATGNDTNYTDSLGYTYSGTEVVVVFNPPITPITPSANLDSYILSFDAMVQGLEPGVTNTTMSLNGLSIQTNSVTSIQFVGGMFTVSSNFTHFDLPLSQLTISAGTLTDLTDTNELSTITGFTADFRISQEIGTLGVNRMPVWGFDNDNQMIVDNIFFNQTSATVTPPLYEKLIWQINFDDHTTTDFYSFLFRDGVDNATATAVINPTNGIGGSAALQITADLTSWATNPPAVFSGFGGGAGLGVPYTLTNTNKSGYRVYWSGMVGGLLPGVTSAPANASIQFLVPPGTLTPSNANETLILELTPNIELTSNYTSFVFDGATTPIGIYNGGSQQMFDQYISHVNLVQVQAQVNGSPDLGANVFGYDADNTMTMDNIKVVELANGIAPLSIVATNGQIQVSWSDPVNNDGTAKLQSATNVAGPYTDVPGATSAAAASPYLAPATGPAQFFRAVWVP
jgi:hypothetical protein